MASKLVVTVVRYVTDIAGVRPRPCVTTFMVVLVSDRRESFGAERTLVRFLTGMSSVVNNKISSLSEGLRAIQPVTFKDTTNSRGSLDLVKYRGQVRNKIVLGFERTC